MHTFSADPTFPNFRDYSSGQLSTVLIAGKVYCGKVYVNLDNVSPYKINRFGMYFDNGAAIGSQANCFAVLGVSSYIDNNPAVILSDTLGWMPIAGTYTATGTENRVTIGNFYNDSQTTGLPTGFITNFVTALYNIDDISLIPIDTKAWAGEDATLCVGDSVHLGRPQEVGLECLWYSPGNASPFSASSDIWFKATQPGTFTLVQKMDNCVVSLDTVRLTVVYDCNTLVCIPNVFTPNEDGLNDTWRIEIKGATNLHYTIYNRWGNIEYTSPDLPNATVLLWDGHTPTGEKVSDGVYYYVVNYTDKKGERQEKKGCVTVFR